MKKSIIPLDEEVVLDDKSIIVSKTDSRGYITYVNDYFCEIAGYSREELIGKNHNIIRHPDMPKAIFYFMWQTLSQNRNLQAVVKNLTKDGHFYWVITDFKIERDEFNKPTYVAKRRKAPRKLIEHFSPIYKEMIEIEKNSNNTQDGIQNSLKYFIDILNKAGMDYDTYIEDIVNKSFMNSVFAKIKSFF